MLPQLIPEPELLLWPELDALFDEPLHWSEESWLSRDWICCSSCWISPLRPCCPFEPFEPSQ